MFFKKLAIGFLSLFFGSQAIAQEPLRIASDQGTPDPKFMRGARRTPPARIAAALATGRAKLHAITVAAPPQVIRIPPRLSMWGNNQYGDCVTAESAAAIAAYSTEIYGGAKEIFITEAAVIAWARAHGVLNGADLLSVIQDMESDGIKDENGVLRKEGVPSVVDFSHEDTLQSAIAKGPLSIAIAADALPSGAGNKSGWYAIGGRSFRSTDHCVSLFGYGKAVDIFKLFGVPLPAGVDPSKVVYLLFTWNTIGIVDHAWLMGTCEEAWLRSPTITGLPPPDPPTPPDPPQPPLPPTPPPVGASITLNKAMGPGTFFFIGPESELAPIGTTAKYKALLDKVREMEKIIGVTQTTEPPVIEKKEETKPPPIKKVDEEQSLETTSGDLGLGHAATFNEARERAIRLHAPLVVGVGTNPPRGPWMTGRVEPPHNGWKNPCVVICVPDHRVGMKELVTLPPGTTRHNVELRLDIDTKTPRKSP